RLLDQVSRDQSRSRPSLILMFLEASDLHNVRFRGGGASQERVLDQVAHSARQCLGIGGTLFRYGYDSLIALVSSSEDDGEAERRLSDRFRNFVVNVPNGPALS